jgi:glycosyltransferase involved in cell wall biosynthesis
VISVIIPTIQGREFHLKRCLAAYALSSEPFEVLIVQDKPTCGEAWQAGAEKATGDYLHFSADDLEPHDGWWEPAIACAESGKLPCPRILSPDGSLESCGQWGQEMDEGVETNIARIPFLSREMWEHGDWIFPAQYYGDNWFWHRGQQLDIPTVICRDYLFTHYYASEGRLETYDQDLATYQAAGGRF